MTSPPITDIALRTLRGTGEPFQSMSGVYGAQPEDNDFNMTDDIVRAARELGVGHYPVNYYASIAPAGGLKRFDESYYNGWNAAARADAEGIPTIWVGYSLGALILGDLAAAGELNNCIGMVLLADPTRHRSQVGNAGVPKNNFGCVGERKIPEHIPLSSKVAPDDPIGSLPDENGFRLLAQAVTGIPQSWNLGYVNLGAMLDAVAKYLGTPGFGPQRPKASRHVIYNTENEPGLNMTYTKAAGVFVQGIINNHREDNQ